MQRTTGLIHIYHGDGKGKTTSAMGLALRSLGHNHKVVIAQFLKDGTSGECRMLAKYDNLTLLAANPYSKFTFQMTDEEKEQTKQSINRMFKAATQFCINNNADLLILDEICAAITTGMLDKNVLISFLENKPTKLEVVMTGRNPSEKLISLADYVTEMKKQKHPFDQGIVAREGIEQ